MTDDKLERVIACIDHPVCRALCRYFAQAGWTIDVDGPSKVEAVAYADEGSVRLDLASLTAFIVEQTR